MKILGIDPGGTTGVALLEIVDNSYGVIPDELDETQAVVDFITYHMPEIIVMEQFRLYAHKGKALRWSTFVASEIIGVVNYIAKQHNIPVVMQNASMIASLELTGSTGGGHSDDALKHALVYLMRNNMQETVVHRMLQKQAKK